MAATRLDHVVTSGVFSLDGEDFAVDNNIWLVGDDEETLVIDAESRTLVPHWAELDHYAIEDGESIVAVRGAKGWTYGRRHIVAVRGVNDTAGQPIQPSRVFAALRDNTPSTA